MYRGGFDCLTGGHISAAAFQETSQLYHGEILTLPRNNLSLTIDRSHPTLSSGYYKVPKKSRDSKEKKPDLFHIDPIKSWV